MDNITHSIVGLAAAEWSVGVAARRRGHSMTLLRPWLWITAFAANNFPDLDFFYSQITPGKLGYLLHHRGHTHTLALALPQALLIFAGVLLLARWRRVGFGAWERRWLLVTALTGCCIHIFLDSLNSYGVHPFWPLNNHWVFGDSFFIIEPWSWVALCPALAYLPLPLVFRVAFLGIVLVGIGLAWFTGFVPWAFALTMTLAAVTLVAFARRQARLGRPALGVSLLLFVVILGVFKSGSAYVRRDFASWQKQALPEQDLKDIALSPYPSNPFCWMMVSVASDVAADRYVIRSGVYAPFPRLINAATCPRFRTLRGTMPIKEIAGSPDPRLHWEGEAWLSLSEFRRLNSENCTFRAFLQFSRAPFFLMKGDSLIVGDARFDREDELGFAEMLIPNGSDECPPFLPPWHPPREDLME